MRKREREREKKKKTSEHFTVSRHFKYFRIYMEKKMAAREKNVFLSKSPGNEVEKTVS